MNNSTKLKSAQVVLFSVPLLFALSEKVVGDEDQESLGRGAKAWAENCSRCHNTRAPSEFNDASWRPIVYHMRVRAGLTGQETRDILKFLQASN